MATGLIIFFVVCLVCAYFGMTSTMSNSERGNR